MCVYVCVCACVCVRVCVCVCVCVCVHHQHTNNRITPHSTHYIMIDLCIIYLRWKTVGSLAFSILRVPKQAQQRVRHYRLPWTLPILSGAARSSPEQPIARYTISTEFPLTITHSDVPHPLTIMISQLLHHNTPISCGRQLAISQMYNSAAQLSLNDILG